VTAATSSRVPTDGLVATVTLQIKASSNRNFNSVQLDLEGVDVTALHLEDHSTSMTLPSNNVERVVSFELIDILCGPPFARVEATFNPSSWDGDQPDVSSCSCDLWLPLLVTSFLQPLRADSSFDQAWKHPDLQEAPAKTLAVSVLAKYTRVKSWPDSVINMLCFGGALQSFGLPRNSLGFAAELPSHGCIDETHVVLVSLVRTSDGSVTLTGRSQELRLAEAVVAALASLLRCLPKAVE